MITTKTSDRLHNRAMEFVAMSDALYEAGMKYEARLVSAAAETVELAAIKIEERIEAYAIASEAR
jgi:hypothetical protein